MFAGRGGGGVPLGKAALDGHSQHEPAAGLQGLINPEQRSALGTLGMAAFEAGQYARALQYWEQLLAFEAPGTPGYQMLTTIIAEARTRGGLADAPAVSPMRALQDYHLALHIFTH